jgi:hypothetical protein
LPAKRQRARAVERRQLSTGVYYYARKFSQLAQISRHGIPDNPIDKKIRFHHEAREGHEGFGFNFLNFVLL